MKDDIIKRMENLMNNDNYPDYQFVVLSVDAFTLDDMEFTIIFPVEILFDNMN